MFPFVRFSKSLLQIPFCSKLQALRHTVHAFFLSHFTGYGLYLDVIQWMAEICYALDQNRVSICSRNEFASGTITEKKFVMKPR